MVDQIDSKIIQELQKNSREKYVNIAKKLGISEAAVRKRVTRLTQNNIVKLTAIPDPGKVGYHSSAMIGIWVQMGKMDNVIDHLLGHPNITFVGTMAGRYDILIAVICKSPQNLSKFIKEDLSSIKGIVRVETFVILQANKRAYWSIPDLVTE